MEPPAHFLCAITQDVMTDPVITADGHTYEREAIEKWLKEKMTSPKTGRRLSHPHLVTNWLVRSMLESAGYPTKPIAKDAELVAPSIPAPQVTQTLRIFHGNVTTAPMNAHRMDIEEPLANPPWREDYRADGSLMNKIYLFNVPYTSMYNTTR